MAATLGHPPVHWAPAGEVWCAMLVLEDGDEPPQNLLRIRWASEREARDYINRNLPAVQRIPGMSDQARIVGVVVPATTHTQMDGGELVQQYTPVWGRARRAVLDSRRGVTW